jgi:autotransporter-associated beta strand protein
MRNSTITALNGGSLNIGTGAVVSVDGGTNAGLINGLGGLTKTSASTLTLSGANTYTGATNDQCWGAQHSERDGTWNDWRLDDGSERSSFAVAGRDQCGRGGADVEMAAGSRMTVCCGTSVE